MAGNDACTAEAFASTDEGKPKANRKRSFLLFLFSDVFFVAGSTIYLWEGIESFQWANGPINYDDYYWYQLPSNAVAAAGALGYDQQLWDTDAVPDESDEYWDQLTPEQQEAAIVLGYDQASWDDEESQAAAAADDDYVFHVKSADTWVSRYMIQYFVAAMCFVVVGILDLVRQKKLFHCLMIIAGLFGVLSAMFVERNAHVSNVFDCVSVHFYFLEALVKGYYFVKSPIRMVIPILMAVVLMFADVLFGVGALIEVVLSYIFLFDVTADFNTGVHGANIAAQSCWVVCSLIYIVYTIKGRPYLISPVTRPPSAEEVDGAVFNCEEMDFK